jgi:hypothetical protein
MHKRTNFIVINEAFVCQNCQHPNPPLPGSCRNHCQKCLYSLHLDLKVPGDRHNDCFGLMKPIALDYNGKKGYIIIHQCQRCGVRKRNKTAPDDEQKEIIKVERCVIMDSHKLKKSRITA